MATCVAHEEDSQAEYVPTEENLFEDSVAEEDVATDAGEEESEEEGSDFMILASGDDQTTDVSQTSKNMLKAAACVGANSCVLWQVCESGSEEEETEN